MLKTYFIQLQLLFHQLWGSDSKINHLPDYIDEAWETLERAYNNSF